MVTFAFPRKVILAVLFVVTTSLGLVITRFVNKGAFGYVVVGLW